MTAEETPMPDTPLILHHYDFSNYAEKTRLALGYKGLAWRGVTIPPVAPKPDLTPLTGGYRRTPVLQIGADIFCDTHLILRELERYKPEPTLYPQDLTAIADMIAYWAEHQLFRPMSLYVSGTNADLLPDNLQADRSAMRGLPVPDAATMQRATKRNAPLVRAQLPHLETLLSHGWPWIAGPAVTVADFSVYHALWFMTARSQRLAHELAPFPRIADWMIRMRAFGHGDMQPMQAAEALLVAADAEPATPRASKPFAEDPPLGSLVRIRADDYGRDPVEGELVLIDTDEIAVSRRDGEVGNVVVHFPRLGYDLRAV
jgi:glutathione S-transferase